MTAKEKKLSGTTFEDTAPLSKDTEKGCFPMTNSIVNDRTCPRHKARTIMFTPDLKDNRLTSDGRYWSAKPNTAETAAITRRMQRTSPLEVTPERFCKFVAMGGTWTGALFEPGNRKGWGEFKGMQVFALDFDHAVMEPGGGTIDPLGALDRAYGLELPPLCLYFTFSATLEHPRFRIVFAMDEPVRTAEEAKAVIFFLLKEFPEADPACKNPNRLFYGSGGEVWPCWAALSPFSKDESEVAA